MTQENQEEPSCPCHNPDRLGHYNPGCPDYCEGCNFNMHRCHTCGEVAKHGEALCIECQLDQARQGEPRPDFVRIGMSWVDPSRVVAVVESDIERIRIHLDTGANLPTGIRSTPEAIQLILQTLSDAR